MTKYELMYIIDPTLEQDKKDAAVETVKEIVTTNSGEVSEVDVWGMRKLAYPIEKKEEGYYVVMEFKAGTDVPKELDRRLKISDAIIRHQIINKDAK
ncbi:ribosomal protein S6 [Eubacterium nodatum ATCC 33099]|nr:ribosomal protein S6 [Eubacterium nodatum ATCC 33099]